MAAMERGAEQFRGGNFGGAIVSYSEAIKADPTNHLAYSNRSACYAKMEKWEEAQRDAEICVKVSPGFAKGWGRLGTALQGRKMYEDALAAFNRGNSIESGLYSSQVDEVTSKIRAGQGVASEKTRNEFYFNKSVEEGTSAFGAERYREAARLFGKAADLAPTSEERAKLLTNRSSCFFRLKEFKEAAQEALRATEAEPSYSRGWARAALSLIQLGSLDEASRHVERALRLDPTSESTMLAKRELEAAQEAEVRKEEAWKAKVTADREADARRANNPEEQILMTHHVKGLYCFKCQMEGHRTADCTKRSEKVVGGGYATGYDYCKFCNKYGHVAANCPDRKRARRDEPPRPPL